MHQRRVGRFERGVIVPEHPEEFDEGEVVEILGTEVLSPELEASIEQGLAEIDRGEWVDGFEFLKQLKAEERASKKKSPAQP